MIKKTIDFISYTILIYFVFGGLMYEAGAGAKAFGIATYISAPFEYIATNIQIALSDDGIGNGHLKSYNDTTFNKLEDNIYILNTSKYNDKSVVEEINLLTGKSNKLIEIGSELESLYGNRQRYLAHRTSDNNKIIVMANHTGSLACYDISSGAIEWVINTVDSLHFHHRVTSTEDHVLVNIRKFIQIDNTTLSDEGFARIDLTTGKILSTWWITNNIVNFTNVNILNGSVRRGNKRLNTGNITFNDFWHINDVTECTGEDSTGYLKNGDVLLSARNINSILIIRKDSILRIVNGPFSKQHDVDIVNNNTISVFNNAGTDIDYPWENTNAQSYVTYYNLFENTDSSFNFKSNFYTSTEGQFQVFEDYKMIENQNTHEILLFKHNELVYRGPLRNSVDSTKVNLLNWTQIYQR